MRLPRMTTTGLIIAVAVSGFLVGSVVIGSRWQRIRSFALAQAAECERLERSYTSMAGNFRNAFLAGREEMTRIARINQLEPTFDSFKEEWASEAREEVAGCLRAADFHARMKRRFQRVASQPWLTLPSSDPFSHEVLSPRERQAMNSLVW